ncbi:MAG: hypothetical protein HY011_25690 [Acidobacteria bacterium]|nr:hypothetical protein [Acidobacteriota bacterium]
MTPLLTCVIQADDRATATHLCHALEADARLRVTAVFRTNQQIYEEVMRQRPAIVVLMLSAQPQTTWALAQAIQQGAPGVAVICAAQQASTDLILDTLRNGAHEFLRLPIRPEELRTVLDRIVETHASDPFGIGGAAKRGRVTAVFSPRGGCGTSFIAANLAAGIHAPTVLVDLNLQASSLDLYLGLKPRFSWVDLIENQARLDDQMLVSLLTPFNERLSLLAAPAKSEDAEEVRPEQIHDAINALRARFDHVLLDVMHSFDALTLSALDAADDILLVLGLDIVSVRAAQRALTIFQRLEYPRAKTRLVLNRWNQHSELELREVERALGQPVRNLIPDDYRTVVGSLNLGQPLLAAPPASAVAAELQKLLADCELPRAEQQPATKRGLLDMLLRRNTASLPATPPKTTQPLNLATPAAKQKRTTPLLMPPAAPVPVPADPQPQEPARSAPLRAPQHQAQQKPAQPKQAQQKKVPGR